MSVPKAQIVNLFDPLVAVLVVANVLPILPVVLDLIRPLPRRERRRTVLRALLVGNLVAVAFAVGGTALLDAMKSRVFDLRVAGGVILLVFAVYDLLFSREDRKEQLGQIVEASSSASSPTVGIVPLGVPLLVGPATLTTALVVVEAYGAVPLTLAMGLNALINAGILLAGELLMDYLGHGTVRAVGKVFGLILATLAVTMIRTGIMEMSSAS